MIVLVFVVLSASGFSAPVNHTCGRTPPLRPPSDGNSAFSTRAIATVKSLPCRSSATTYLSDMCCMLPVFGLTMKGMLHLQKVFRLYHPLRCSHYHSGVRVCRRRVIFCRTFPVRC